jgi:hypothetical protein
LSPFLCNAVKVCSANTKLGELGANLNMRLGLVGGYNFPISSGFTIGPEIGLAYNLTRKFELPKFGVTIQENYLTIPMGLKMTFPKKERSVIFGMVAGYEFDFLRSSQYEKSGGLSLRETSWRGQRDLIKELPDLPTTTGSIFVDLTVDFSSGLYLVPRLRVPLEDAIPLTEGLFSGNIDKRFMHAARATSTSLVEITVGFDSMKYLYPAAESK